MNCLFHHIGYVDNHSKDSKVLECYQVISATDSFTIMVLKIFSKFLSTTSNLITCLGWTQMFKSNMLLQACLQYMWKPSITNGTSHLESFVKWLGLRGSAFFTAELQISPVCVKDEQRRAHCGGQSGEAKSTKLWGWLGSAIWRATCCGIYCRGGKTSLCFLASLLKEQVVLWFGALTDESYPWVITSDLYLSSVVQWRKVDGGFNG